MRQQPVEISTIESNQSQSQIIYTRPVSKNQFASWLQASLLPAEAFQGAVGVALGGRWRSERRHLSNLITVGAIAGPCLAQVLVQVACSAFAGCWLVAAGWPIRPQLLATLEINAN